MKLIMYVLIAISMHLCNGIHLLRYPTTEWQVLGAILNNKGNIK